MDIYFKKLIQLYNKFVKQPLNIHGIEFTHELKDDYGIVWTMKNRNDLSYNNQVFCGYIEEMASDFFREMDNPLSKEWREKLSICYVYPEFYLNSTDKNTLKNKIKEIKVFEHKGIVVKIDKINKFSIKPGYDYIHINLGIVVSEINGVELDDDGKGFLIGLYDDHSFLMDTIYIMTSPVLSFLNTKPTLVNDDYMYFEFSYTFFDKYGEEIKYSL